MPRMSWRGGSQCAGRCEGQVDRLKVYAPVAGIVQGVSVTAVNAVVRPGEVIMQIVPVDEELIVESG